MNPLRALLPGCALAVAAACARGSHPAGASVDPLGAPVRVEVRSNYALPVTVSAAANNSVMRLGTVLPGLSATFSIPRGLVTGGTVQLIVDPGGSDRPYYSEPFLLAPGRVVDLQVAAQLFNSTANIRR